MGGFYKKIETPVTHKKKKNTKKRGGCFSCKRYHQCNNGQQSVVGTGKNGILIVDGTVSRQEEEGGAPLSGIAQKYLKAKLDDLGIDINDCWYVHAVRCFFPYSEKIPSSAMSGCKELLIESINTLKPSKVILLGEEAVELVYNDRAQASRIQGGRAERYYGHSIPDQELGCWVFPIYPSTYPIESLQYRKKSLEKYNRYFREDGYIWEHSKLSTDDNFRIRDLYFKKQLKNAITHYRDFFSYDYKKFCISIESPSEAIAIMDSLHNEPYIGMDFETNMIKPYHPDAELLTISFATKNVSYGFNYYSEDKSFMESLHRLLMNENVKKIIAHVPMELAWTRWIIGCDLKGITWDTVLASHFLAPTISAGNSLKFNTLITTGVLGYDNEVEDFISSPTKTYIKRGKRKKENNSVYSINRMKEFPMRKRNLYCSADSLFTVQVFLRQYKEMRYDEQMYPLFKLYLKGLRTFTKASEKGFVVKEDVLIQNLTLCDTKIISFENDIANCKELEKWYTEYPNTEFNPASSQHLRVLFFDLLGYDTEKRTKNGQKSTDADVMTAISIASELAGLVVEYSKYVKIEEFLEGIRRNTVDGVVHPDIGLSIASTGRSSSQNPNFQNLPVKDKEAMTLIKSCLTVPEGYEIYAPDYSNLEVRGGYSIHGDETLKAELEDDSIDPHSLMASRIFGDNLDAVTLEIAQLKHPGQTDFTEDELKDVFKDDIRTYAKSPNFLLAYGGSANRLYKTLWSETFKDYHKEFFTRKGLGTFEKFKAHCQGMYDFYWERYRQLYTWREATWEAYLSNGYVYSPEGFRINGIVTKNLICNAPIQGASFAVALRGLVELDEALEEGGYESYILLQIHDSDEIAVKPSEFFNGLKELIHECTVDYVNEVTPWLKINMEMDGEYFMGDWGHSCKEEDWLKKYKLGA